MHMPFGICRLHRSITIVYHVTNRTDSFVYCAVYLVLGHAN